MPVQTLPYSQYLTAGAVGALANAENFNAISRTATNTIGFGAPVQRGAADHLCNAFTNGGEFLGVARRADTVNPANNGDQFVQYDDLGVITEGVFWGLAGKAIAIGTALKWDITAQRWTDATASSTVIAIAGAEADTTAAAGGSALFKVRLVRVPS